MEIINLLKNPLQDKSFSITHWCKGDELMFGVSFGYSFSEFYSEFNATEYFNSPDRPMLEKQISLVNAGWFVELLKNVVENNIVNTSQVVEFCAKRKSS